MKLTGTREPETREAYGAAADRYAKLAELGRLVIGILATQKSDAYPDADEKFRPHWNMGRVEGAAHKLGLYDCIKREVK